MSAKKRSSVSKDEFSPWIGLFVLSLAFELFIGIDIKGCGVKTKTLDEDSWSAITIFKNYESLLCILLLIPFIHANQTLFYLNSYNYNTGNF